MGGCTTTVRTESARVLTDLMSNGPREVLSTSRNTRTEAASAAGML